METQGVRMPSAPGVATGTIAPSRFVKPTSGTNLGISQAGAGDRTIGIMNEAMKGTPGVTGSDTAVAAESGDAVMYYIEGAEVWLELGGSVNNGSLLKSDSNGKGVATTTGGDFYGAQALKSGSSGELCKVRIKSGTV